MCCILFVRRFLLIVLCLWVQYGSAQNTSPLFKLHPSSYTGVTFSNTLTESDSINILTQANIYNGAGVGVGDFNNDGLSDLYFAGNMVSNKLYLNRGVMKFEDITTAAGVNGEGRWCTGVSVIDINVDGRLDIYVSASFRKDTLRRTNLLYINEGNNAQGVPRFKESAKAYGLANTDYSTQAYFFDYDRDGDLDMFQVINELYDPKTPINFRPKLNDGSALNTDKLYRNNGNNTFTDVSAEAGVLAEGWGHAASISDFNMDGWPDIYVANDFVSNDVLYINNRDGTFTNKLGDYFKHGAWNAMGSDVADINNDGFADLISLEMLPEENQRKKRMLIGNEYYNYFNSSEFGYEHQYVRNVLQLNSGMTPLGHPVFSDVSFMAGVYQTDWSWCPLVADFDNDGFRDLIVLNGLPRDVTDLDYIAYDNGQGGGAINLSLAKAQTLPIINVANYGFKNEGGLRFQNKTKDWGLTQSSFSNGGAYADLDNDGDLDFVSNNINSEAFVYENTLVRPGQTKTAHTLSVKLEGPGLNKAAIGSKLHLYYGASQQFYEHQPSRGYLSTVDNRAHFGLGPVENIDSLKVYWPDGKLTVLRNVKADQLLTITYNGAATPGNTPVTNQLFTKVNEQYKIHFKPEERDFIDYTIQATLPHKLSQYGPGIAVGDIDKNGFDDFYLGGTSGNPGIFFMQDESGSFSLDSTRIPRKVDELEEEMGVLLFDADNDGDLDLYAVTGSYEIPPANPVAQDRLFINDGKGRFKKAINALPKEVVNGSCVRASDFDKDGDLDLFVGGRVVSGGYPANPKSFIYKNVGGKFVDVTQQLCPQLGNIGMITDALWSDFDKDGKLDLVLTGEWMPVTFLKNTGTAFVSINKTSGISNHLGWWNSIVSGDFDNDGDVDYIAGNLGLNSVYQASAKEPMTILAKDIDNNNSVDAMLFCYLTGPDGVRRPYPMHTRDDLSSQLVSIRKKYPSYKSYGYASIKELWTEKDKINAIQKTVNDLQSSYINNKGNGQFEIRPLPLKAQAAPLYGMLSEDINGDGNLDLLLVGNDFGMEPGSGRHDALNGLTLLGDGTGNFKELSIPESGFFVKGDGKALAKIHTAKGEEIYVATQNLDSVVVMKNGSRQWNKEGWITLKADDFSADIIYKDGKSRRMEFYYGSGFLSQSSRRLFIDKNIAKITITNYKGQKRDLL
ncbi:MAG TPA: VCBS repeat-containing protein [Chitinophagaceae bacterium]|nr:VCBS repeat-containing protein [Chitinophagaceae bacterium]